MTAKQIKEQEAEDAIQRQSAECARNERGARTGRFSAAQPNFSVMPRFHADLAACKETNS